MIVWKKELIYLNLPTRPKLKKLRHLVKRLCLRIIQPLEVTRWADATLSALTLPKSVIATSTSALGIWCQESTLMRLLLAQWTIWMSFLDCRMLGSLTIGSQLQRVTILQQLVNPIWLLSKSLELANQWHLLKLIIPAINTFWPRSQLYI